MLTRCGSSENRDFTLRHRPEHLTLSARLCRLDPRASPLSPETNPLPLRPTVVPTATAWYQSPAKARNCRELLSFKCILEMICSDPYFRTKSVCFVRGGNVRLSAINLSQNVHFWARKKNIQRMIRKFLTESGPKSS